MQLSKYSRIIPLEAGESYCLANTINKALVKLKPDRVDGDSLVEGLFSEDELAALDSMGFFISDEDGERLARQVAQSSGRISISIELSLECNLRCPYCYQGSSKVSRRIPDETLDVFCSWASRLLNSDYGLKELSIKVLGGEPSIRWSIIEPTLRRISALCRESGIRFILMIDTNGYVITPFLGMDYFDKLLLTVPVTHRNCHDSVRMTSSGKGTYDTILENVKALQGEYPGATIVLRHNTDEANAPLFESYLDDLTERGFVRPLIDLNYTASFQNTSYQNGMTYSEYQHWRAEKAIPSLLEHSFPVLVSPTMNLNPCQRLESHSFKMFSDGTIGYCAMDFFSDARTIASDALSDPTHSFFGERQALPDKCYCCESFFLCGGSYILPCIRSLDTKACEPDGAFNIPFEDFVRFYMAATDKSLFVVFNQDEIVR